MKRNFTFILLIIISISIFLPFSVRADEGEKVPKEEKKRGWGWLHRDTLFLNQKITTSDYATSPDSKWGLSVGGFICVDLFWDNREMVGARDGGILLYPTSPLPDINGRDINATTSFNFLAMNSRISVRINAPDVLGAKVSGLIEGWFMGASNTGLNNFALRHSFIRLNWKRSMLLMGQTWHPMFTENCFATTLAASTGAPFQPFSRAPQIRFTQKIKERWNWMMYVNTQLDQPSAGPDGATAKYLRNSAIPEVGTQFQYESKKEFEDRDASSLFLIGMGADYKRLVPRLTTSENVYTKKGVNCAALILFTHYKYMFNKEKGKRAFGIKGKVFYGGGYNEMLMTGGYAVRKYDDESIDFNHDFNYTTIYTISGWLDLYAEINRWEFGLFNGYCKNLGTFNKIQDHNNSRSYWGRGTNIDHLYRLSLRTKYSAGKLQFGIEPEYTLACYGKQFNEYGSVLKSSETRDFVHGFRLLLSTTLYF